MENTEKKSRNRTKAAVVVIAVLGIITAAVFIVKGCSGRPVTENNPSSLFAYDSSAVEGGWEEADTEKIVESLNEKVEEGMINISMNTSPTFRDGASAGDLMIVNESVNRYPQIVEIVRNDTGEKVYRSGGIPVGSKVESAVLDVDLDAGTYDCTAMFYNVDPNTGESLGCAGAIITVTVLE